MNKSLPLVSIIVVTYNSAKYVTDTLESAKNQTYENIELIVTDDCSKDDTIQIVETWLRIYHTRFKNVFIVPALSNGGISKNINKGLKEASGTWIKLIAGDDILLPGCISSNLLFAQKSNSFINFSKMQYFKDGMALNREALTIEQKRFFAKTQENKLKSYIRNPIFLNIPTIFLNSELIKRSNGFIEEFRLLEDQPFIIQTLLNGYDINFMNEETVKYRIHGGSITGTGSISFLNDLYKCYKLYREPHLKQNIVDALFKAYIRLDFYLKLKGFLRNPLYRAFNRVMILVRILS